MHNKPYQRNERLAHNLLKMLTREIWNLHGNICTLTYAKLSKDFKYADIYCQTDDLKNLVKLQESEMVIRHSIKKDWNAKYLPTLRFHIDKEAERMDKLRELYMDETFRKDVES